MGSIRPPILGDPEGVSRAEERRDENFQARAEEPLGTDSQRTISKRSSKCWLLIGHKKCFLLLYPIGEEFLLSSFRESVHDGYCLSRLTGSFTKLVHARETFIFYFPDQKRRNYWWVEKTFRMLSAGAIQFAQESQKSNSLAWQNKIKKKKTSSFCTFLCRHCTTTTWTCLISRFTIPACEGRKQAMTKFSFSSSIWIWLIEDQLQKSSLAFDKVSELE